MSTFNEQLGNAISIYMTTVSNAVLGDSAFPAYNFFIGSSGTWGISNPEVIVLNDDGSVAIQQSTANTLVQVYKNPDQFTLDWTQLGNSTVSPI